MRRILLSERQANIKTIAAEVATIEGALELLEAAGKKQDEKFTDQRNLIKGILKRT